MTTLSNVSPITTLHILNKAPGHPRADQCLAAVGSGDALLLIENGVLHLATGQLPAIAEQFALDPDASARGLQTVASEVTRLAFPDMVSLSLKAQRIISW